MVMVACAVCGSTDAGLYAMAPNLVGQGEFRIARCLNCDFVFVNPRLPQTSVEEGYISLGTGTVEADGEFPTDRTRRYERFLLA